MSRISTDNVGGGKIAADNLAQQIGGKGTVAVINVNPGISTTDAAHPGLQRRDEGQVPEHQRAGAQYDNDSSATAASQVASDIAAHPNLNGVFATNVLSAQGAATGVQHAGKSGKVKVATFDAEPQQIQASRRNTHPARRGAGPVPEGQDGVSRP